ncbi:MAG: phosphomannomutase/phosphoglucomutase [candidate division KSB1 bacterium]|nr:phosphomannomutase/phosphoglucomutase [candidate division KSB1 bacterium]MDZ7334480.1 phosphomannomutase/phosphoglucomutase [candidate division KSB1 bacterium]MDZ7356007.1 phosphomannomutase/phosphoglucomutase [candidate division KSB1 bacterium]MDZ7400659.1 phosphomannomutase/phosphoglucomutase [candidate division KSB1 bacterium]
MINPNIFREYDIRGIAETELTDEVIELIGRAFGTFMGRKGRKIFMVGRDVRLSSERIKNALIRGITATGGNVIDIGEVPTPVLYFSIVHAKADGGVMVTGSHNPIEFNGLKMSDGIASIYGQDIQKLRVIIEQHDFLTGSGQVEQRDFLPDYIATIKSKIKIGRKLKVVIDAGNGTAGPVAPQIWRDLGCEAICLYCEPDGRFPNHLPDPTVPKYVKTLQQQVITEGADLGIGYDGDADRIGAIDEKGRMIFADRLIALFSRDVLRRNPGAKIVFDVKCSQALPEYISRYGGQPLMWKTGHALLKAKMKAEHAPFAGEMSGHLFFADDYFGFDDAIYASGRLLQILSHSKQKLSEMIDEIPYFVSTPEIRVECSDDAKFDVVADLARSFKSQYETIDIDGARVLFGDGWGLVRASNTQPVLVLRFEAKDEHRLSQIKQIFKQKLREYPSVKFEDSEF